MAELTYCTKCLNPHTRPRITFNDEGVCNACLTQERKKLMNWDGRWEMLQELCEQQKKRNVDRPDVIVPYSGGKDGAYIAYTLREKLGMRPLCVTIRPPMEDLVGVRNIQNFLDRGYDHVMITPNRLVERAIDKENFINKGIPMHAFMMAVQAAVMRCSVIYDIPLVMFAEEGESEMGGDSELANSPTYEIEHSIKFYLSGVDPKKYLDRFSSKELYWFLHPTFDEMKRVGSRISHWSFYQEFVNYKHYLVAKEHCGLEEKTERGVGTFDNYSTTDTELIWLYFYLMYLKFGFGRATNVVATEIRRGAMTRKQAVNLVRKYDGEYPEQYVETYLKYYDMTQGEFDAVLDKWANKDLFEKQNGRWVPKFTVS
jgi:N-acetyl sugar amidotransferase